jgi:hypothetical protein
VQQQQQQQLGQRSRCPLPARSSPTRRVCHCSSRAALSPPRSPPPRFSPTRRYAANARWLVKPNARRGVRVLTCERGPQRGASLASLHDISPHVTAPVRRAVIHVGCSTRPRPPARYQAMIDSRATQPPGDEKMSRPRSRRDRSSRATLPCPLRSRAEVSLPEGAMAGGPFAQFQLPARTRCAATCIGMPSNSSAAADCKKGARLCRCGVARIFNSRHPLQQLHRGTWHALQLSICWRKGGFCPCADSG